MRKEQRINTEHRQEMNASSFIQFETFTNTYHLLDTVVGAWGRYEPNKYPSLKEHMFYLRKIGNKLNK